MKKIIFMELIRFIKSIRIIFDIIFYFDRFLKTFKHKRYLNNKNLVIIGGSKLDKKKLNYYTNKKKIYVATLNLYALTKLSKKLIPDFYCLMDPGCFNLKNKIVIKILKYVKKHNIYLVIPIQVNNEFLNYLKKIKITKILYINASTSRILNFINPLLPKSFSGMTILSLLSFSLYLNAKKIYIIGFRSDIFRTSILFKKKYFKVRYESWNRIIHGNFVKLDEFLLGFGHFFSDCYRFEKRFPKRIFNLDNKSYITSFKKL